MSVAVKIPEQAEVSFKFEISTKANITPFVAKQSIDDFLLNSVGNLLCAGEPEFFVSEDGIFWKVPVHYTIPSKGTLGVVGYLLVDMQTGEIVRTIEDLEEIKKHAEMLYKAATSQAK